MYLASQIHLILSNVSLMGLRGIHACYHPVYLFHTKAKDHSNGSDGLKVI